jgi:hypothetical protein
MKFSPSEKADNLSPSKINFYPSPETVAVKADAMFSTCPGEKVFAP